MSIVLVVATVAVVVKVIAPAKGLFDIRLIRGNEGRIVSVVESRYFI